MAKSSAQRQADYRARHLHEEGGEGERLNLVIDLHAKRALERLALCYGVTQKAMLNRLLIDAERAAVEKVAALPDGYVRYYDGKLKMEDGALRGNVPSE